MNPIETFIRRPTFTAMLVVAVVVTGLATLRRIPVDLFPNTDYPIVSITASYPGAAPEEMETLITKPIEDQVSTIAGIKDISSQASEGASTVILEFNLDVPIRQAAEDVREKINRARRTLPRDLDLPLVETYDPSATPIMYYGFSGDTNLNLSEYAENVLKVKLQQLPGVGTVTINGERLAEIDVRLNAARMAAYDVPINTISTAIKNANQDTPGGNVNHGGEQDVLRLTGKYRDLQSIGDTFLTVNGNVGSVQVKDVAEVAISQQDGTTRASVNGRPGIVVAITKQSDANTVSVAHAVKDAVDKLEKQMPDGYRMDLVRDESGFIEDSAKELQQSILLGGVLAIAIVWIFLRDWRATLIAACAIPVSLIASFALMMALGYTLNMMTMMALSLSVGLLIDDAIVVVDNIYRHLEAGGEGGTPMRAALEGTQQIALAVLAVTLSLVAVFVPIGFVTGVVGRLMGQFAFTVAGAVLVSMLVAFSFTPMLASRVLKAHTSQHDKPLGRFARTWEAGYARLEKLYGFALGWALDHRAWVVGISVLLFISSLGAAKLVGTEFIPQMDQALIEIDLKTDAGTSLVGTQDVTRVLERELQARPEIETVFTTVGDADTAAENVATVMARLQPWADKSLGVEGVKKRITEIVGETPGAQVTFHNVSPFEQAGTGGVGLGGPPIQLKLIGSDLVSLAKASHVLRDGINHISGAVDVHDDLDLSRPEFQVLPQRDLMASAGVDESSVMTAIQSLVGGVKLGEFSYQGQDRDIMLRLRVADRQNLEAIGALNMSTPQGPMAVHDLVTLRQGVGPVQLNRDGRSRVVTIQGNVEGRSLGEVTADVKTLLANTPLPKSVHAVFAGDVQQMQESFNSLALMLGLAVLFIYMVLASQFESLIHPFTIMLSLPLAVVGALFSLLVAHQTVSIISGIGIITLMGLVTKNAILLVDYANQLRDEGLGMREALLQAGPVRLRPIMMTTSAMILGMLPMALGLGAGAETRQAMGVAVVGGLVTSTLLTLLVVPVVYSLLDRFTARARAEKQAAHAPALAEPGLASS